MKILVTGCCGYIGSHTLVELLNNGYEVVGLDNFSNSKKDVLDKIEIITGKQIVFYECDMLDKDNLRKVFQENKIEMVIDFAAYKAVGESVEKPISYYINNVSSVLMLLDVMKSFGVKNLIFSSSATVYGMAEEVPLKETSFVGGTTNPYGTSKLFVEKILMDLYNSDNDWNICIFRYFNPIGAHSSGLIGENPNGVPANLMPYIVKVAKKELECLNIFGDDYDTVDGTGVRDYIHIMDLALAHILGVKKLCEVKSGLHIYNLGTGKGISVLELVNAFKKVNNVDIPYKIAPRRAGDIAECYASIRKAREELGFIPKRGIDEMCFDAYNYVLKENENGKN